MEDCIKIVLNLKVTALLIPMELICKAAKTNLSRRIPLNLNNL
jgi:hypothetical protein